MFDIENFPRAEEVNSENLASAIFENEINTIFWAITEAVRKDRKEVVVDIRCGAIIDFLKERAMTLILKIILRGRVVQEAIFIKLK